MSRRLSVFMAAITILVLGASVAFASLPADDDSSKNSDVASTSITDNSTTSITTDDDGLDDDSLTSTTLHDDDDDDSLTSTTLHDDDDDDSLTSTTLHDDDDDDSVTSTTLATAGATPAAGTTSFDAPGVGSLTVAWDGANLTLVRVSPAPGWTHTVDEVTARSVEIDFWNGGIRHRAKVEVENGGLRFEHFEK